MTNKFQKRPLTPQWRAEYAALYAAAELRPEHQSEVKWVASMLLKPAARAEYDKVSAVTGVPWYVIGIIHSLEASLSFKTHLHNGDPLTARTVQVPAGRPAGGQPPFAWHDSAVDALQFEGLDSWTDWSLPGIAFALECYNGFGYRDNHPATKSPYLWSYTTVYTSGKYVRDHLFDPNAVSNQCGGMAVLKQLADLGVIAVRNDAVLIDTAEDARVTPQAENTAPPPQPVAYPGMVLRNGIDNSTAVRALQVRLNAIGIKTGTDGDFGDQTENAVRLFQARATDSNGASLDIDGIVGPRTWAALFGSISVPSTAFAPPAPATALAAKVIEIASSEVGVREQPSGSNRGPRVDQYMSAVDPSLLGAAWCMAFVYWVFNEASQALGVPTRAPRTAGVIASWQKCQSLSGITVITAAQLHADYTLAKPGMVFFLDTGGGSGHTGIVVDNINGDLVTIEGNTNDNGSREGVGVFRRSKRTTNAINLGLVSFG